MSYIRDFLDKHPIYNRIKYSTSTLPVETNLYPLLSASQAVIDSLLESGHKRIAIIMPDDEINILPLIIAKYLSNIQEIPDYAHSIFDDIEPGQRLKLGKAVVEYISLDKENKIIKFLVGKPTKLCSSTVYTSPFQGYHLYFERSNGALSKETTFLDERKEIKHKLEVDGIADIDLLALKRTVVNKTIAILSPKKEFKEFLDEFFITGKRFQDVVAYGEFDESNEKGTALYNSGRLDCLPGIIVSPKINEIAQGVSTESLKDKFDSIVVTQAKFNEAINNLGELKKCLKADIPFIVFAPETEFESFPVLSEMGFEFWNWDPNMLIFGGLSGKDYISPKSSLFGSLSKKVFNAAGSTSELKTVKYSELRKANSLIRQTIKRSFDNSSSLNQITRRMNKLVKLFIDLAAPISDSIGKMISTQFDELKTIESTLKPQYEGTDMWEDIQTASEMLRGIFEIGDTPKSIALSELIKSSDYKSTIVLVPDRFAFVNELQDFLSRIYNGEKISVFNAGDFCRQQSAESTETDHLIVTFFDQSEYIKIKKTYCYKKITYLLYSFENAWRRGFVNKYESCVQREAIKKQARSIISRQDPISDWEPLDLFEEETDEIEEISEFNFERELITSIIRRSNTSSDRSDSAECIPVILDQDTIGYFSPNHNLIDITPLCHGELDRPVKKDASKLCKGDIVLIRQSDKDIIYDKANELMTKKGEQGLREVAELWVLALQQFAEGKTLPQIKAEMNKLGANCETNQIRYWLMGETICPENGSVIEALSVLCPSILPRDQVESVLNAGSRVQEYHREAGRWLTSELKYKAGDILSIYQSGQTKGSIEEIGDVHVYAVEAIFEKEFVDRNKINRLEVIS